MVDIYHLDIKTHVGITPQADHFFGVMHPDSRNRMGTPKIEIWVTLTQAQADEMNTREPGTKKWIAGHTSLGFLSQQELINRGIEMLKERGEPFELWLRKTPDNQPKRLLGKSV